MEDVVALLVGSPTPTPTPQEAGAVAELIQAIAALISALAWPAFATFAVVAFRAPIGRLIDRVSSVKLPGIEAQAQVREQIAEAAEEARLGKGREATPAELARAQRVEQLAQTVPTGFLRQEAERLAVEYERVRASMPAGDTRTRAMEVVVSKMRTIGRAAFPLRHELAQSASPGRRLLAIAILQVEPDYDLVDWLAQRPASEKPFVAYHAMLALDASAADARATVHAEALRRAVEIARQSMSGIGEDTDRNMVFTRFAERVTQLRST